jgi:hypothetical protein
MSMIGICGDNCEYCPRYRATQNGTVSDLEKVKELWVRLGLRDHDFPVIDMACHGCKSENKCAYLELCTCVNTKGLKNCGLCDDYPCKLINKAFDKSERLKILTSKVCSQEEMDVFHKAFFSKKEYFDRIHQKHHERQ